MTGSEPIPRVERLAEAAPALRQSAVVGVVIGGVVAAAELLLFGWDVGQTVVGALVGTGAWGALGYLRDKAKLVPRGRLMDAPRDVEVERNLMDLSSRFGLIGLATLCVPVAWLVDRFGVGAAFMPGVPFGDAIASLIALGGINRWERAHRRRVLYEPDAEDVRPYIGERIQLPR
jgi:hypothetical protein